MSEKRSVPTFQLYLTPASAAEGDALTGPVVSPDKSEVATDLSDLHRMLRQYGGCLCYAKKWWYVPHHAIVRACGDGARFALPWPLVNAYGEDTVE